MGGLAGGEDVELVPGAEAVADFEGDFALVDSDADIGGGVAVNAEGGAEDAGADADGVDDEGEAWVGGDGEVRFAEEVEFAVFGGEAGFGPQVAAGGESGDGAVGEGDRGVLGGGVVIVAAVPEV